MYLKLEQQEILVRYFKILFETLEYLDKLPNKSAVFYRNEYMFRKKQNVSSALYTKEWDCILGNISIIFRIPKISTFAKLVKTNIEDLYNDIELLKTEPVQFSLIHKSNLFKENIITNSISKDDLENLISLREYIFETV